MFTEGDSDDEIVTTPPGKGGYTHLNLGQDDYDDDDDDETRDRSQSMGSEQIGRFEVHVSTTVCSCTSEINKSWVIIDYDNLQLAVSSLIPSSGSSQFFHIWCETLKKTGRSWQ